MYKKGDRVKLIPHKNLGEFSGKKGTIIRRINDNEVLIQDDIYGSKFVYEVDIPLHGTVQILDGFIENEEVI